MKTMVGLDAVAHNGRGSSVTIGTFDGLHLGHRALIAAALEGARASDLQSTVVTWDRHPSVTVRPDFVPPLLTSPGRKVELIGETGVDALVILPFDRELSSWPPERFVEEVLVTSLGAKAVFVGEGWRFGRRASGNVELLSDLGRAAGFEATGVPLVPFEGEPVSSSRARKAIANGDVELAHRLLARPFDIDGVVVAGDGRGKDLGFPTANLETDLALAAPARGVYAGRARVEERWFTAAVNVGVNPTFGGDPETQRARIEAYLVDFDSDLYGETVRVEFHVRLRDEQRFPSAGALVEQMRADVARTRELIG